MGSSPIGGTMRKRKTFTDVFGNELGVGDWVLVNHPDKSNSEFYIAFISKLTKVRFDSPRYDPYCNLYYPNRYYQGCAIKYPKTYIPKNLIKYFIDILASRAYHDYCFKNDIHELPFEIEDENTKESLV